MFKYTPKTAAATASVLAGRQRKAHRHTQVYTRNSCAHAQGEKTTEDRLRFAQQRCLHTVCECCKACLHTAIQV